MDNRRIIRVIYLAVKLGFEIDREIKKWIKENPSSIKNVKPEYLTKKWQQCLKYDQPRAIEIAKELGVVSYLPLKESEFLESENA